MGEYRLVRIYLTGLKSIKEEILSLLDRLETCECVKKAGDADIIILLPNLINNPESKEIKEIEKQWGNKKVYVYLQNLIEPYLPKDCIVVGMRENVLVGLKEIIQQTLEKRIAPPPD